MAATRAVRAVWPATFATTWWLGSAPFDLRAYSDAPTQRTFDYFVGRGPRGGRRPEGGRPAGVP
jgi:hypothetical protein